MTYSDTPIMHANEGASKMENASEIIRKGFWDGRSLDPSLPMFREAVQYAERRGLTKEYMPELRSENGVLHAFIGPRRKLRLEPIPDWEQSSGYAALVDELRKKMDLELLPST